MTNTLRTRALLGLTTLSLVAAAVIPATYADTSTSSTNGTQQPPAFERDFDGQPPDGAGNGHGRTLTDEEKTLLTELKTARDNKDETAIKEIHAKLDALRTAEMKKREAALDTAIAGGYETWKAYVTENDAGPKDLTEKITADNFATYVDLHAKEKALRAQMDEVQNIRESLGLGGLGFGGGHHGGPRGK